MDDSPLGLPDLGRSASVSMGAAAQLAMAGLAVLAFSQPRLSLDQLVKLSTAQSPSLPWHCGYLVGVPRSVQVLSPSPDPASGHSRRPRDRCSDGRLFLLHLPC